MKKKYLFLVLTIVILSLLVLAYIGIISPYFKQTEQENKIAQITQHWESSDYPGVIELAESYLSQYAFNNEVLVLYGFALFNQAYLSSHERSQVDNNVVWQSIHAIRKALEIGLDRKLEKLAYYVLGKNYYLLSGIYLEQSIYYLEQAMNNNYIPEDLYEFLSKAYFDNGNTEKSINILLSALEKKKSFILYLDLVDIYFEIEEFDKIKGIIDTMHQYADSEMEKLVLNLRKARLSMENNNLDLAINEFSSIIEVYPQSVEAHYYLGNAYEKLGNISQARYEWRKAYRLAPYWDKIIIKLDNDDAF